jgi:predicted Zn-dependent protease
MMRVLFFIFLLCFAVSVQAQEKSIALIRDAESEALIREIARPIFLQAGLVPENIHMYLINSRVLNAFVAGGQNMFLHTGLITWSEDPYVVAGVIAHEAGHIAGGHLVRSGSEMEGIGIGTIMSYVLGAATMAAGAPDAGAAILSGGSHIAQSMALSYSRAKEEAADQAAVNFLSKLNISSEGLVKLLVELNSQQHQQFEKVNPYALTHPLSTERIQFLRAAEHNGAETAPKELQARYTRMVAKILAFMDDPEQVKRRYPSSDQSPPAQIARAILAHRGGDLATAMQNMDLLIKAAPQDGYLYELKGQIYFEQGKIKDAIIAYQKAVDLLPKESLIRMGLGIAYLADGDTKQAIEALEKVVQQDKEDAISWRQLGIAYGKAGDMLRSNLALAEEAMVRHNIKDAKRFIALSKPLAKDDNSAMLRLGDMEREIKQWKKE